MKKYFAISIFFLLALLTLNFGYVLVSNFYISSKNLEKDIISRTKFNLVENRLLLIGLSKISPEDADFYNTLTTLLDKLKTSREKAYEEAKKDQALTKNNETRELLSKTLSLLESQTAELAQAVEYTNMLAKIYQFDPIIYFSQDLTKDSRKNNISAAILGLNEIKSAVNSSSTPHLSKELDPLLEIYIGNLESALSELDNDVNYELSALYKDYEKLQNQVFLLEKKYIFNQKMISLLQEQTNLIIELENL